MAFHFVKLVVSTYQALTLQEEETKACPFCVEADGKMLLLLKQCG